MPNFLHTGRANPWAAWFRRIFRGGANTDIRPELLPDGLYTEALNMRPLSVDGNTGALEAVQGEQELYPATVSNPGTYVLIGSCYTNGHEAEWWASTDFNVPNAGDNPPFVRIDGDVAAMSPNIPYVFDRPLQIAVVDRCRSGVVYPADHLSDPLFWDIGAMLDALASGSQAYFSEYSTTINSVGLNAPPSWLRLDPIEPLVDLIGAVGLPVGQYTYALRYVDVNGNRTNWSPPTPLIPVPAKYTADDTAPGSNYPGGRTFGGSPNLLAPTPYGINLRFRVDNELGYASIEIKRTSYRDGQGLLGPGTQEIIYRIPIQPNLVDTLTFVDPANSNLEPPEVVPDDESVLQFVQVKAPKSVDYSDGRLKYFNFRLEPRKLEMGFIELSTGKNATSITRKMTRRVGGTEIPDGFSNPYNATYYKSAQRGEQYGYGVQAWDGGFGKYPVQPIAGLQSYQHPSQRDIKGENGAWAGATDPDGWGEESDIYSDDRCWNTTTDVSNLTPEGPVGRTFSSFTQGQGTKTDTESVVNVALANGSSLPGTGVGRIGEQFNLYGVTTPSGVTNVPGVLGAFYRPNQNGYLPWTPQDNQGGSGGYNIPPVSSRMTTSAGSGGDDPYNNGNFYTNGFADQVNPFNPQDNRGKVFAPTYHSLGLLLGGITNIPSSATAITITRTAPAGRVIAQGFGSYVLSASIDPSLGGTTIPLVPANKSTTALDVYFPEFAAGITDQATLIDIQTNPQNYRLQMQCGVGFYDETYAYSGEEFSNNLLPRPWIGDCVAAHLIDTIKYGRITEDHGQVNQGEFGIGGMGYQPTSGAPPGNYVGFDKWRSNLTMQGGSATGYDYSFWQQQQTGNAMFDITSFVPVASGRSNFYRLTSNQFIYSPETNDVFEGGTRYTSFYDTVVRNFHQPWFIVNLIRVNAEVPDANIAPYVNTGATFATRTTIGIYNAPLTSPEQNFRLEDEYEYYNSVGYLGTDYRYAYVRLSGIERRYLCVTNNTLINVAAILADITSQGYWVAPDGDRVYGLYDAITDADNINYLRFGVYGTIPESGSRVIIKYPEGTPIRVWGHDRTIAPVVHCVQDASIVRDDVVNGVAPDGIQLGGLPLPYAGFGMNPRYFMPEKESQTEEQIFINYCSSIRQMCIMWDAETLVYPDLYVNLNSTDTQLNSASQTFPHVHCVCRPMNFDGGPQDQPPTGFFPQYQTDYPLEWNIFTYGGTRFQPGLNLDYCKQQPVEFFGYPQAGFVDNTDYCTGYIASEEFDPLLQDSPGLRTFLSQNLRVLSEETGEIKVGATYLGPAGQNTVVWTQKGVCRILTNKNVLTGASGEQVSTQSISNYWGEVMFLSRDIGCPDQFWRLWVKAYATAGDSYVDTFYWPNRKGWYRMRGDQIDDISRNKVLKKVRPILEDLPAGYAPQMSAFFNVKYQEMWASISPYTSGGVSHDPVLLVYSPQSNEWLGEYSYRFDGYVNTPDAVLGMRDASSWELDTGYTISGGTREAWVYLPIIGDLGKWKEMVRFRIVGDKPDGMQLFNKDGVMISDQSEAIQEAFDPGTGFLWVKLYDSYEGWWWAVMESYDPLRPLPQDVRFFVKVLYNTTGDKMLVALENELKNIR